MNTEAGAGRNCEALIPLTWHWLPAFFPSCRRLQNRLSIVGAGLWKWNSLCFRKVTSSLWLALQDEQKTHTSSADIWKFLNLAILQSSSPSLSTSNPAECHEVLSLCWVLNEESVIWVCFLSKVMAKDIYGAEEFQQHVGCVVYLNTTLWDISPLLR